MSDEQGMYAPGEAEVRQPEAKPAEQSSQPEKVEQAGSAQVAAPKYVTLDDLQSVLKQYRHEIINDAVKSLDKRTNGVEARVNERLAVLEDFFNKNNVAEKDRESVRQSVRADAILEMVNESAGSKPTPTQGTDVLPREVVEATNARARALQEKAGVFVEQGDPEWAKLKVNQPNPYVFLDSLEAAIQEKALRIGKQREGAAGRLSSTTAGATAGNPIGHVNDPKDLFKTWLNGGR